MTFFAAGCAVLSLHAATLEQPLFSMHDGNAIPRALVAGNVLPFLTAPDFLNLSTANKAGNTATRERIDIIKANPAFIGLADEAQTCLAQLIIKKGLKPNPITSLYRLDYVRAYQAYVHACRTYPNDETLTRATNATNKAIRDACLDLVHQEITVYQKPFLDALLEANTIITKPNLQELFDALNDPLLKMAVRVMRRHKTIAATMLDDFPINQIFMHMIGYGGAFLRLNFESLHTDNQSIQMIINLITTLIDNNPERAHDLRITTPPSYKRAVIISSHIRKLDLSDNNITSLAGIICPALVRLDINWNDNLQSSAVEAFRKRNLETVSVHI
jgi:hypothetical protein